MMSCLRHVGNRGRWVARVLLVFAAPSLAMAQVQAPAQPPPPAVKAKAAEKSPRERWETAIRAFEEEDKVSPPPKGAVLFVGASSVKLWKTLAEDFPGYKVINRGFGGSEMGDSAYFADR